MKLVRPLSPSLEHIERTLFGISPALIEAVERGETSIDIAESVRRSPEWAARHADPDAGPVDRGGDIAATATDARMPARLRELVKRRLDAKAATATLAEKIPAAGQIVEVREIVTPSPNQLDWVMQVPLYVLLDEPGECDTVWHGWQVSGEADYAGWWDFVLQDEDAPFEPEAAVVHLWNPVRIYVPMARRVVARLEPERLQGVRALAAEYVQGEVPAGVAVQPGIVAVRETTGGLQVVTGSPLGGDEDPRHRYQHLYFCAADAIKEPARLALAAFATEPDLVSGFIERLVESARRFGGKAMREPRIALAMSENAPEDDFVWDDIARISVLRVDAGGGGRLEVKVSGEVAVTCELRADGLLEQKIVLARGQAAPMTWVSGEAFVLTLVAADGRRIELPLD